MLAVKSQMDGVRANLTEECAKTGGRLVTDPELDCKSAGEK